MRMPTRFEGKTAVIVGGGSGFGLATALRLSQEGATVLVIDEDPAEVDATCAAVAGNGGTARGAVAVIDDLQKLQAIADTWSSEVDSVHALVTNYITLEWGSFEECEIDAFARVVHFTLVGPAAATKAFLPLMKRAEQASIVHIGSIDGIYGNPRAIPYSTAKAGLGPFTRITAREFAQFNIRVNMVAAGMTNQVDAATIDAGVLADSAPAISATGRTSEGGKSRAPGGWYLERITRANPLKRNESPEVWAGAVAFLASDDATLVTGTTLTVDCGRTGLTTGTFDPEGYGD